MKNKRLLSLDLLRGLDMLLLTVIGPVFWAVDRICPQPRAAADQFRHLWGGFTLWDIIMPLFIFVCGTAIPYALSKRLDEDGRPTPVFWGHVLSRVVLLWFCGMLVQGSLATLDLARISPYNNTLEAIAAGYLIGALVMLIPARAVRIAIPVLLAGTYGALLHFLGDYSKTGNFAAVVEARILTAVMPSDNAFVRAIAAPEAGVPYHGYTWFLTTLMFGFMTLCGAQCAEILRGKGPKRRKAGILFALGAALLGIGWGLVPAGVPTIKHIFTVSFTCQAMGWSVLALALLYVLTDIIGVRRGWWIITLFGQCALTAYMASSFFHPALKAATDTILQGYPHLFGEQHLPLASALVSAALLTLVCWIRRRMRGGATPAAPDRGSPASSDDADDDEPAPPASSLMEGAIASRFQIPGLEEKKGTAPKPAAQGVRVKTKLKIHKGEPLPADATASDYDPQRK